MADDPDEGAEGVVGPNAAPAEGEGEDDNTNVNDEATPFDELASKMGWTPKTEFKGDPGNWKSAEQFILDGKDIQRAQSRDLKELRSTVDNIARTSGQILADRIDQEKSRLAEQYAAAVEDGDADKAFKIGTKINNLDSQPQPKGSSPEVQDWVGRNPWMNADPLAARLAVQTCNEFAHLPQSQQLELAEREVRRVYPHLFDKGKPPPGVNPPESRSTSKQKGPKTAADMPREALKVAKDMVERGVIPNVDVYAKNYWATEGQAQ